MGLAEARLLQERKQWRKDHPFGFFAKPAKKADNSLDIMSWQIGIPGEFLRLLGVLDQRGL